MTKQASKQAATPSNPILLSGGNPQIPKGEGDAPVQAYLAAMPGWKQGVGRRLDALIVETVPERGDIKSEVFKQLDQLAKPDAILASNTSGIPITALGEAWSRGAPAPGSCSRTCTQRASRARSSRCRGDGWPTP